MGKACNYRKMHHHVTGRPVRLSPLLNATHHSRSINRSSRFLPVKFARLNSNFSNNHDFQRTSTQQFVISDWNVWHQQRWILGSDRQNENLFRRYRESREKSMSASDDALRASWNIFITRWNRIDMRAEIERRKRLRQDHCLVELRDELCMACDSEGLIYFGWRGWSLLVY